MDKNTLEVTILAKLDALNDKVGATNERIASLEAKQSNHTHLVWQVRLLWTSVLMILGFNYKDL